VASLRRSRRSSPRWRSEGGRRERRPSTIAQNPDRNAEARIQAAALEWLKAFAPELIVFHVPNGGYRSKAEAARLKWQGVVAGVADLCIVTLDGRSHFLEVKAPGGYLSPEQRAFADRCAALRVPFAVIRSIDDARQALAAWSLKTREAL
jgi:hypothetical protein